MATNMVPARIAIIGAILVALTHGGWTRVKPIGPDQIAWFGISGEQLVAVWPDGMAGCWNIKDGTRIASFSLGKTYKPRTGAALLAGSTPRLAFIQGTGDGVQVKVVSVLTGQETKSLSLKQVSPQAISSNASGTRLVCISGLDLKAWGIDVAAESVDWTYDGKKYFGAAWNVAWTGDEAFLVFEGADGIGTVSSLGKVLWERAAPMSLVVSADTSLGCALVYSPPARVIMALDARNGAELWKRPLPADIEEMVVAVSPDAKRQATWRSGVIELHQWPGDNVVAVDRKFEDRVELKFDDRGQSLAILPDFQNIRRDGEGLPGLARPSNTIIVVDCASARVTLQMNIVKPRPE